MKKTLLNIYNRFKLIKRVIKPNMKIKEDIKVDIKIFENAFPSYLKDEIHDLLEKTCFKHSLAPHINNMPMLKVNEEILCIPSRFYFPDMDIPETLTDIQKDILYCIYSRNHNGYVREKYLKKIILSKHKWVIPYVMNLLGEYVVQMLEVIYKHLTELNSDDYIEFINENLAFYQLTKARIASYWDCYYPCKYKKDYVGFNIQEYFDKKLKEKNCKL
jgi:hypothetical protein